MVEHRIRLENGTKVFADYDRRLSAVEPRQLSPLKVVGFTLALVTASFGALLWLTERFAERPTHTEARKLVDEHGHEDTQDDIRAIQQAQTEQRVLIEQVQVQQAAQDQKLDTLLQRLPERRRGR